MRRSTFILGLALVAGLICAGWWLLRSPQTPSVRLPEVTSSPATVQQPATPVVANDVAPTGTPAFATFRGRVIDAATRAPLREFELRFAEWGRTSPDELVPGPKRFVTDDGRFEWPQLPAGRWSLIAAASGYQRFLLSSLELIQGRATSEVLIPLTRGHTVRGRVYDEISNTGIASAFISFHDTGQHSYDGKWRLRPQAQSQKDGSFVLDGVPPGRMTLEVGANNYAPRELDLVVDDDLAPLQIGLSPGGVIAGRLTAADGVTSVAGSAGLFRIDGDRSGSEGRTTENGEFSFWGLGPGRYRLTGRGPGGSATREFVISNGERIEGIVLTLSGGGGTIRGTVTGLRPADLRQLFITLRPEGESGPAAQATINERGEYEVRNVQPGRARLSADVSMRRQLAKMIDVPANTDMTVDFDFPRGARVSGRVTQRGRPVGGAWLEPRPTEPREDLYLYGAATQPTGYYVIEDVPPGEYTIWIDGYKSRPFQVTGDTVFDIDASPQLAGRILEDNGNVPIAAAELQLWPADPKSARIRAFDRTDHFGRFSMAGLEPRDFVLTVYKSGYAMFHERIAYASPILDKTIRLRRDAGVEVRAHDAATGKPLRKLVASEMLGDRPMIQVPIPLDERGVGYVPGGLEGTTVAFWANGYATQTFNGWNGESLVLKFVR